MLKLYVGGETPPVVRVPAFGRSGCPVGPPTEAAGGPDSRESGAMLWVSFCTWYVDRLRTRYGSTYPDQVDLALRRFTRDRGLYDRTLESITTADVEAYLSSRKRRAPKGKPLSARTLNNEINILNQAFRYAGPPTGRGVGRSYLGLIETPPWVEPLVEFEQPPPVALSEKQIAAFLEVARQSKLPRCPGVNPAHFWTVALLLGLVSALRRRALLSVPRPSDEILIGERSLIVPADCVKTRNRLRIPLGSDEVVRMVAELPTEPGEPLLPWKSAQGRPMSLDHFSDTVKDLQRAAGIPDAQRLRFKDLRSTAATECVETFSPELAKRRLGHSPQSTVIHKHYVAPRSLPGETEASVYLAAIVLRQLAIPPVIEESRTLVAT